LGDATGDALRSVQEENLQALSLFYPRMLTSPKSEMEGKGRKAEACIIS
jgi:hypothetical protein